MAVGNFVVLDRAKLKVLNGTCSLSGDTFKAALAAATWTPGGSTYAGTSTDARYADIGSDEISGTGYTSGGQALTSVTLTRSGGTVKFTSAAPSWGSSTLTAKWLIIYDNTSTNKDIIGYVDLNNTSSSTTASDTSGTFSVTPDATNGWFIIS